MDKGAFLKEMVEKNYDELMESLNHTKAYVGECEASHMAKRLHDCHSRIISMYQSSLSTLDINDIDNYNYTMLEVTEHKIKEKYRSNVVSGRWLNGSF